MYAGRILEEKHIDMKDWNPKALVEQIREIQKTYTDPQRIAVLDNLAEHAEAECLGNLEALIGSCSEKRQTYAVYGCLPHVKEVQPKTVDEMKAYYEMLISSNLYCIHAEIEKLIVDDKELFIEIIIHQLYPGDMIPLAFGFDFGERGEVYQLTQRVATIFLFDEDNKGCGEISFTDGESRPDQLRKEDPKQVPEYFWNNPLTGPRDDRPE